MSETRISESSKIQLERYLDGELTPREHEEIKLKLADCSEYREELERLSKLRVLVREVYLEQARTADLDEILPGVMKKIAEQPEGVWVRFMDWLEKYRLELASPLAPIGVAATLVVAIVAGVLIAMSGPEGDSGTSRKEGTQVAQEEPVQVDTEEESKSDEVVAGLKDLPRRPAHEERPFHKNEAYIVDYEVDSGIVVIDVDPEGDAPAVVWHFPEDSGGGIDEEDNRI